jgi:hypothetical protein
MPAAYELRQIFFCIFFTICWYAPAAQPPPKLTEANKILADD